MASEQEQLVEQLKQIVESLKSVSQYSKDLSSAVAAANRPMQQMSDYAKAIRESMEAMATASKDVTASETASVAVLNEARAKLTEQKTETELLRAAKLSTDIEERKSWADKTRQMEAERLALKETESLWERIKKNVSDVNLLNKERTNTSAIAAGNTAAQGLTGATNMQGGLSALTSALGSLAPTAGGLGGLLGMMMYGKTKEAEFNALGQIAAQQFDAVGGFTDRFASRLTSLTRQLSVSGAIAKEDIAKVSGALAGMGLSADEVQTKIEGFSASIHNVTNPLNDFMSLTMSLDAAFEMAAGSSAKFGGTLVRDFNMSTADAAQNLLNMAQAAKDSGANVAIFMQQTMEASSALRLMNANQEAVFATQARAAQSYQKGGLNKQFAGAYAAQGTQQLTGAIGGGMNEGVRAVIAQRMFGGDALDALYKLQSPVARGGKELDTGSFIQQMSNIMKESGVQGMGAQYKFSESVFGVGTAGADAMFKAIQEQEKTGKVSELTLKEISGALNQDRNKKSVMERIAEQIRDAVANVMVGLLGMIVAGLKLLYNGVMAGFNQLMSMLPGVSGVEEREYKDLAAAYMKMAGGNLTNMKSGASQISAGLGEGTDAAKQFANVITGPSDDTSVVNRIEAQRAARWKHARDKGDAAATRRLSGATMSTPYGGDPDATVDTGAGGGGGRDSKLAGHLDTMSRSAAAAAEEVKRGTGGGGGSDRNKGY